MSRNHLVIIDDKEKLIKPKTDINKTDKCFHRLIETKEEKSQTAGIKNALRDITTDLSKSKG